MSTAAYRIEAIWEGQAWLLEVFNKLKTAAIGRSVAGTFGTTRGKAQTSPKVHAISGASKQPLTQR
jgi:hypothetical protein